MAAFGLPRWLSGKESPCNAGDLGSICGSGRSLGEGNGNPLQYSCLENPMDRGAWWATVRGVAKELDTTLVTKQQQYGCFCITLAELSSCDKDCTACKA